MDALLPYDDDRLAERCHEVDRWGTLFGYRGALPRRWDGRLRRDLEAGAIGASVSMEGIPVTVDEVRRILAGGTPSTVTQTDAALVTGYRDAMAFVIRQADAPNFRWSAELFTGLHDRVLAGSFAEGAGRRRTSPVWVADRATGVVRFAPPAARDIDALVDECCTLANERPAHPAVLAAWLHVGIAAIHPFADGNGRTARVLASAAMYRGGFRLPEFTSLEEWWGRHVADYHRAFRCLGATFDRASDVTPFIEAHLNAQLTQVRALDIRERIEQQIWTAIENAMMDRGLQPRVANAVWDCFFGRTIAAGYYRDVTDVQAATATTDLAAAVAAGLLRPVGQRRARVYVAGPSLYPVVAATLAVTIDDTSAARDQITGELARRQAFTSGRRPSS